MKIKNPPGSTPLEDEDLQGLIPNLTTQGELNEFEAQNISDAIVWAKRSRTLKRDLLSVSGFKLLHEKMFDQTWKWAGEFRKRETNIGSPLERIQNDLAVLLGDVQYWLKNETFALDEIAVRLKHRLVAIHPFANGNGRHSRLVADLLMEFNQQSAFTWGRQNLVTESPHREIYLKALRIADKESEYRPLLKFAKS